MGGEISGSQGDECEEDSHLQSHLNLPQNTY
jgi:hypothetical protein